MDNGIFSKNCITDFPSITFPTQVSLITGTYTGDFRKELCHGIPLGDWMGRNTSPPHMRRYAANDLQIYKINKDLGSNCQNILEMINEGNKTSIVQFINRGTNYFFPENKIKLIFYYLLLKYSRYYMKMAARVNTNIVYKLLENFKNPRKYFGNNEAPIASLLWFMTSDILMHLFGYDSYNYKLNLIHIDKVIGILIQELKKLGYLNDTAIALTSDHGNYKANKYGNFSTFFNRSGLYNFHPRKNLKGNVDIAEFGGVGFINFKGSNTTSHKYCWTRPTIKELENFGPKRINIFEKLFHLEDVGLMYYRDDDNKYDKGAIQLKRKDRNTGKIYSGIIEYRGSGVNLKTRYSIEDDNDCIFGYHKDMISSKMINNKFHSIREWMDATHQLDYPMYPDLISRHFKNPRSSDIIISTSGRVLYNYQHGKKSMKSLYTHDIGLRKCAIVPLIIGGSSEIPQKEITYCMITDIVPTLLKLLGKTPHKSVIGNSLI